MTTSDFHPVPHVHQRRSQRVMLSVSIMVSGRRPNGSPFLERTKTLVVNAHGGLIQLREPVNKGQKLRITNLSTNEEVSCTVASIDHGSADAPEVGVGFDNDVPAFWHVAFPPDDWTFHSSEAKHVSDPTASVAPAPRLK